MGMPCLILGNFSMHPNPFKRKFVLEKRQDGGREGRWEAGLPGAALRPLALVGICRRAVTVAGVQEVLCSAGPWFWAAPARG